MDYKKHYNLLTERAKRRKENTDYYENHHIIPKCIGGSDKENNLVKLTPEEHYVTHQLLVKIYPDEPKLIYACRMMCTSLHSRNNKEYGWIRRKIQKSMKTSVHDAWARKRGFDNYIHQMECFWGMYVNQMKTPKEICDKFSINNKNIVASCLNNYAEITEMQDQLKNSRYLHRKRTSKKVRKNFTPEQEQKRIESVKNIKITEDERKRRSEWMQSVNKTRNNKPSSVKCPWCDKVGGDNVMKRWHFDNCKHKRGIYEN